ncbi:MAG: hypothetical protein L6R40_000957 [Gallowayella cf. fulva]|nr:MAG: hypothetical protein L6R40_000957 [Xanthomendoza cf. fulva]
MGGDLNLKKSWHPVLMTNQRRVWEEEKKALDERKRIEQMMKERQEERQIQELQEMQEAAGGKKRLNRVDWMYSGPSAGQAGTTEEMEGYLLGKRRIDGLIKGTENKKLEKQASEDSFMALQRANTVRDTALKIREDPMLAIKKQEQAAYEALMNDPVKRRLLLKAAAGGDTSVKKERKHRKHHHRDERRERHHSHKRRRVDDSDRIDRRSGHEYRRRSDVSSFSRSPSPYRRNPPSPRSPSPYQRRSRSPSPYCRRQFDTSFHRRSASPHNRRRSRTPVRQAPSSRTVNGHHKLKTSNSWHNSVRRPSLSPGRGSDERAAKLAAMQTNASELDQDREKRITAIAEREAEERKADELARARSAKHGGRGDFVYALNRQAGELDIGERMKRGRQGLERNERDDD